MGMYDYEFLTMMGACCGIVLYTMFIIFYVYEKYGNIVAFFSLSIVMVGIIVFSLLRMEERNGDNKK